MSPTSPPRVPRTVFSVLVVAFALAGVACSALPRLGLGSGESHLEVRSGSEDVALAPSLRTAIFLSTDNNTADIYLTDLPAEAFTSPGDLRGRSGSIVHIHLFFVSRWGKTPVDAAACNFAMRHAVVTGGRAAGVYAGGGFLFSEEPHGSRFSGSVRDATVRLLRADPAFADRLGGGGAATVSGTIAAQRDDALARAIAGKFEGLVASLPEVAAEPGEGRAE